MPRSSDTSDLKTLGCIAGTLLIVIGICVALFPSCSLGWQQTVIGATGTDYLVIQYDAQGKRLHHWELKSRVIKNEDASDGIYFRDNGGNIVHLSGFYTYIQVFNWDEARALYLPEEK